MSIVVSILAPDLDRLARAAHAARADGDVLELRLDALDSATLASDAFARLVRELGKPVVAAVHGPEGFGEFAGPPAERFALLRAAARAGAAFVDIDARFAQEFGAPPAGARRIVSHHEKAGTPSELGALFDRVESAAREHDLVKVVTHAACAEDGLRVLAELRARTPSRERIAFCSGPRGAFTRVLAPLAGSRFTYAAPVGGTSTAPGQLDARALRAALASARTAHAAALATRWFAVLGKPVAHSWSPRLHGALFRAFARDAVYVACEPDDVARFLELARELPFDGFSITAPIKADALRAASEATEDARALGAANTLVRARTGWSAANTDAPAVRKALERAGAELARARVLVIGAGGAARAAVWALKRAGARVAIGARRPEAAAELARALGAEALDFERVARERFDVLVHATPAGSRASTDACAVPAEWIAPGARVLDAVYRPAETELLRRARARGAIAIPGTTWFQCQAQLQSVLFLALLGERDPSPGVLEDTLMGEIEALLAEEGP